MNRPVIKKPIHVAVAVVKDSRERVLLAKRPGHKHLGGYWEFPGGKVEPKERVEDALLRELEEEIGITPTRSRPLIRVHYEYPEKTVVLDTWLVTGFTGQAAGLEGQEVTWASIDQLGAFQLPPADEPIVNALRLPETYLITPEPAGSDDVYLKQLERSIAGGRRLIQFRAKTVTPERWQDLARGATRVCREHGAKILFNGSEKDVVTLGADGLHLTSHALRTRKRRGLSSEHLLAASCHNENEVRHACEIGVDFIVLGAVHATASHPHQAPLGWHAFRTLAETSNVPVYALGGMRTKDILIAQQHGGQGIAAIRSLWV